MVTFYAENSLFIFNFEPRQKRIAEGSGQNVGVDNNCFRFEMNALYEQDTLSDARDRIAGAMIEAQNSISAQKYFKNTSLATFGEVIGSRDIQVLTAKVSEDQPLQASFVWRLLPNDMLRFEQLTSFERH